jgi:GDPmannose 4,6-dehydratase
MDLIRFYRDTRGLHASTAILYNHESAYRAPSFLSARLARAAASREKTVVGSLSARVDWGWVPDYTDAMQRIVATQEAGDFVVATGIAHSVEDFARAAFAAVGLDSREYVQQVDGIVQKPGATLIGDSSKLRSKTGWAPSIEFEEMVARLVSSASTEGGT